MADDRPALPRLASAIAAFIPRTERDAILGDLLEDAGARQLAGLPLTLHLCGECAAIAAGFSLNRVRAACSTEPARDLAFGLTIEGGRMFRDVSLVSRLTWTRVLVFCAATVALALAAEFLVGTLLAAAGLRQ